jgi:hypothetical protein
MTFFGKMNFQSNGLRLNGDSVKCTFSQMAFGHNDLAGEQEAPQNLPPNEQYVNVVDGNAEIVGVWVQLAGVRAGVFVGVQPKTCF